MMLENLSQKSLMHILIYSQDSGKFTWRNPIAKRSKKGCVAGGLSKTGYRSVRVYGARYLEHRLAFLYMTGEFPPNEVDHINHIKDDNRWCNLRAATRYENTRNISLSKGNKTGFTGVYYSAVMKKWTAAIAVNGKVKHLGSYTDKCDAIKARIAANEQYGYHENHGK